MIESPPVSENSTPTLIVPAARTGLTMEGDASAPVVASRLLFKNLRRSIDIVTLPLWLPWASRPRSRRSASLSPEKFQIPPRAADLIRSVPVLGRQTKKARQILADLSGYLAKPNQR